MGVGILGECLVVYCKLSILEDVIHGKFLIPLKLKQISLDGIAQENTINL